MIDVVHFADTIFDSDDVIDGSDDILDRQMFGHQIVQLDPKRFLEGRKDVRLGHFDLGDDLAQYGCTDLFVYTECLEVETFDLGRLEIGFNES